MNNKLVLGGVGILGVVSISTVTYIVGIRNGVKMSKQILEETVDERISKYRGRNFARSYTDRGGDIR